MRNWWKQTWRKHIMVLMRRTNILSTFSLRNATLEENNSSVNGSDSFAMVAVVKMAWFRVSKFRELELCMNYSSGNSIIEEVDLTRKPWRILTSAWNVLHSGIYHKRWEERIESANKIVSFHVPFAIVVLSQCYEQIKWQQDGTYHVSSLSLVLSLLSHGSNPYQKWRIRLQRPSLSRQVHSHPKVAFEF